MTTKASFSSTSILERKDICELQSELQNAYIHWQETIKVVNKFNKTAIDSPKLARFVSFQKNLNKLHEIEGLAYREYLNALDLALFL